MKTIFLWLLSGVTAFAAAANTSVVTGPLSDISAAPYNTTGVEFWPLSTPLANGSTLVVGPKSTVQPVAGNFSKTLVQGYYLVKFLPTTNTLSIFAPGDGSTNSLAALSTNSSSPIFKVRINSSDTNENYLQFKILPGSGVTIDTNQAAGTLTINSSGGSGSGTFNFLALTNWHAWLSNGVSLSSNNYVGTFTGAIANQSGKGTNTTFHGRTVIASNIVSILNASPGPGATDLQTAGLVDGLTTGTGATGSNSVVLGGFGNTASGAYSFVGGGYWNTASGNGAFIGTGSGLARAGDNEASGPSSVIVAGVDNQAYGSQSFVGTGNDCIVIAAFAGVVTGDHLQVNARNSGIAFGEYNWIGEDIEWGGEYNFIGGGNRNVIYGSTNSLIVGGSKNVMSGVNYSFIAGGRDNSVTANGAMLLGSHLSGTNTSTLELGYYMTNRVSIDRFGMRTRGLTVEASPNVEYGLGMTVGANTVSSLGTTQYIGSVGASHWRTDPSSQIVYFSDVDDVDGGNIITLNGQAGARKFSVDTPNFYANAFNLTNISEAGLNYWGTNPPAGQILGSTSSNTPAFFTAAQLGITGGGGGPLSGGFTNGSGQITADGHAMELIDPNTGWTNLNWTDQTLSLHNTNVLDWFNKRLIGQWLLDRPAGNGNGLTNLNPAAIVTNTPAAGDIIQFTSATTAKATSTATVTSITFESAAGDASGMTNYMSTNLVAGFKAPFYTDYSVVYTDEILACTGTNQLLTLPNPANKAGRYFVFLMSSTTGYGSAIITNHNGSTTILTAAALSQTITNGQSLTVISDGTNWR